MNSVFLPFQVGWFLPTVPATLGSVIVFIGIQLIVLSHSRESFRQMFEGKPMDDVISAQRQRRMALIFAVGLFCMTVGVLERYDLVSIYVVLLLAIGRTIEGIAAVRFWRKVEGMLRNRKRSGSLARTLKYRLAAVFVILVGGSLVVKILISGPFIGTQLKETAFIWTTIMFLLSYFGLSKRLYPLSRTIPRRFLFGYILCIAGANIYELTLVLDITTMLIGSMAYSVGFWTAVYFWLIR